MIIKKEINRKIFIFYGNSGTGKTLITQLLSFNKSTTDIYDNLEEKERSFIVNNVNDMLTDMKEIGLVPCTKLVTCTTRKKREYETDGIDYHFYNDKMQFLEDYYKGDIIEYTKYLNNYYGTPKKSIDKALLSNKNIALVLEKNGVEKFKELYPDKVVAIYLENNFEVLKERLKKRKDSEEKIQERIDGLDIDATCESGLSNYIINSDRLDLVMLQLLMIMFWECIVNSENFAGYQSKSKKLTNYDLLLKRKQG
ncbi:MAG: hypothetical protein ACOCRX_00880 [Candidatus Woesearchaeota archaeon]